MDGDRQARQPIDYYEVIWQLADTTDTAALAFNAGADARIAGRPIQANPYMPRTAEYDHWRSGFLHVDSCWGIDAPPCRRKPLRPIREVA